MKEMLQLRRIETKVDEMLCPIIDISDLNCEEHSKQMHVYSRAIAALAIMKCSDVDADTAAKSITDGFNDLGIDAVFNDADQKRLILVQSKWRSGASGGIEQGEMLSFVQGIKSIIGSEMDGCNSKLKSKISEINSALNDVEYKIEVIFCHTGNQRCSDFVKKPILELMDNMNDDGVELLLFSEYTISDIYRFLATGNNEVDINIDDVLLENWGFVDKPLRAYYGTMSVAVLGKWHVQYGNRLFAKNIRYYKGSTDVNNGIQEVLMREPEKFYYYNNGVELLCKKIDRKIIGGNDNKSGLFHLEGVSLVNGAQTTGSIGVVYQHSPALVESAKILVQMIDLRGEDADSAKQITRLTNTQNRIDSKDFAALDPQQERIKEELLFDGIQYLYKSGASISDHDHQILFDEAIVAQACASGDISFVHLAKQNVGALTDDITKKPYIVLFNPSTNSRALVNNVRLLRIVDQYIQSRPKNMDGKKKNILIQGNRVLLYLLLSKVKPEYPTYNTELIDWAGKEGDLYRICDGLTDKMYAVIGGDDYSYAYIRVFKSPRRTKELIESITGTPTNSVVGNGANVQLTLDLRL